VAPTLWTVLLAAVIQTPSDSCQVDEQTWTQVARPLSHQACLAVGADPCGNPVDAGQQDATELSGHWLAHVPGAARYRYWEIRASHLRGGYDYRRMIDYPWHTPACQPCYPMVTPRGPANRRQLDEPRLEIPEDDVPPEKNTPPSVDRS